MNLSTAKGQKGKMVLARAYGDEPVPVVALGSGPGFIEIARLNATESISYPRAYVYDFDDALFSDLSSAHRDGDGGRLAALWRSATRHHPDGDA